MAQNHKIMANRLIFLEEDLKELFTDLHASGQWADGKEISDAYAIEDPANILAIYRQEKNHPNFDLKTFFNNYFVSAQSQGKEYQSDSSLPVEDHIERLWSVLAREPDNEEYFSTLIPLPYPYVVPGGRFNEIYYWK